MLTRNVLLLSFTNTYKLLCNSIDMHNKHRLLALTCVGLITVVELQTSWDYATNHIRDVHIHIIFPLLTAESFLELLLFYFVC